MPINELFDISCSGAEHALATSTLDRVRNLVWLTTSGDRADGSRETMS